MSHLELGRVKFTHGQPAYGQNRARLLDQGHLFRVDMLARGASPCDVATLLGDEIETIEKHYAPSSESCENVCADSWKTAKR